MNYYIQGNKEKADKIKAAFEAKGYKCEHNCDSMNFLYYTINNHVTTTGIQSHTRQLIMRLAELGDYSELELPVQPKFKVGDWVVKKDGTTIYGGNYAEQITIIESEEWDKRIWFSSTTWLWENDIRLWTIADAKDGDVLVTTKIRSCPFIYRKTNYNNNLAYYYAGIDGNGDFCEGCLKRTLCHFGSVSDVIPATKEQRDLLFAKMKEAGYEWDAEKKELKKILKHYDIKNFHAGMPVLVRDDDDEEWNYLFFSHYRKKLSDHFFAGGNPWFQCIPFVEDTKHLLGTTDMPSEEYINW